MSSYVVALDSLASELECIMTGKETVTLNGSSKTSIAIASVLSGLLGAAIAMLVFIVPIFSKMSALEVGFTNLQFPYNSAEAGAWRKSMELHKDDVDVHMPSTNKYENFVSRAEWNLYVKTTNETLTQVLIIVGEIKEGLPE